MTEEEHKIEKAQSKAKEAKKKRKKERRQSDYLNAISESRWRRLGSLANWVTYRVSIGGREEVVPVRRKASKVQLINVISNLKRFVKKDRQIKQQQKRRKRQHAKRFPKNLD